MKKIIYIFLFFTASTFYKAQTNLSVAVDFTLTSTGGSTVNLFSLLNSGKYVCIDFFFTTCGPCQATSPYFKQAFTNYGCNTQEIFFMSIDDGDTDAQVIAYEQTYLGGNAGYPEISGTDGGGTAVVAAYGIAAFPTFILIAPNKQIIETDMWPINSSADFTTFFTSHGLTQKSCTPTSISKNARIAEFNVYPNPAKNMLNIEFTEIKKNNISLINVQGKEVLQMETEESGCKLDLTNIADGIYFLNIKNAEGQQNEKIIIQK